VPLVHAVKEKSIVEKSITKEKSITENAANDF